MRVKLLLLVLEKCHISGSNEDGFTLLEIILAVGILSSISVFAITALSNQMEIRNQLSTVNEAQHAVHNAMSKVFDDMRHAYVLSKRDLVISGMGGSPTKPRLVGKPDLVWFSTHAIRSFAANAPESNIGFVRYAVVADPKDSSKKQLIRTLDQQFKESIERENVGVSQILMRDVKDFKITFWNGQDFTPEWDTDSSDAGGKLPKMAKISMATFFPQSEGDIQKQELDPNAQGKERKSLALETIVYLLYSAGQKDVKEASKEYRWQ
jgi:general secretion pathway protein J